MRINSVHKIRRKMSFLLVFLCYALSFSQDIDDGNEIKFQNLFFDGLTNKAIKNYDTSIEKLLECNQIIPNQKAVFFEISKNYLYKHKLAEAIIYGEKALHLDPENIWILEHLVRCYRSDGNYKEAIFLQEKIAKRFPKKQDKLVFLHIDNKDPKSALRIINNMEKAKICSSYLKKVKKSLEKTEKRETPKVKQSEDGDFEKRYNQDKSYKNLITLLKHLEKSKKYEALLRYADEGLSLFPAQPKVYLMNAQANTYQKKYKNAIKSLNNGIDFIFDNKIKTAFYKQYIKIYKILGDKKNSLKYKTKLKEL